MSVARFAADLVRRTGRAVCPSVRCRGAGIGAELSYGGCCSSPTSWGSFSPSFSRTCSCRPSETWGTGSAPGYEYLAFLLAIPGWVLLLRLEGLYDRDEERTDHSTVDDIVGVFRSVTIGVWVFALFGVATDLVQPVLARLGVFWLLAVAPDPDPPRRRALLCRHLPGYTQNAVIVGAGNVGQQLALKLTNHREYGIRLVGFVDDRPTELDDELAERLPLLLGGPDRLREFIIEHGVERVIFAFSNDSHEAVLANIRAIRDLDVQIDIVPRYFEVFGAGAEVHTLEGIPLVGLRPTRLARSSRMLKRAFDLVASTLGLVLLAPLFAVVAIAIKLESRGPGVLPTGASRRERLDVPDLQVPHDGRRGRGRRRQRSCTSTCTVIATRG